MTTLLSVPLSTMRQLVRLVGGHTTPTGGYGTCGNADGTCVNHWRCTQRQGYFGGKCFDDLRHQTRQHWR